MSKSRAQKIAEKLTQEDHMPAVDDAHSFSPTTLTEDLMNNVKAVSTMATTMALDLAEKATRHMTNRYNALYQTFINAMEYSLEIEEKNEKLTQEVKALENINESSKEQIREVAEENNVLSDKVDSLEEKVGDLEDALKVKDDELKKIKGLWQALQDQVKEMQKEPDDEEIFGNRYKVINKALGKMEAKDLESISDQKTATNVFSSNRNDQQQSPKKLKKAKKRKSQSH